MCGIAGVVDLGRRAQIDRSMLLAMADAVRHRGPDEGGEHREPGVALAARRLSIVGIADGQQPMYNETRSVVVVFNGELFDHRQVRRQLTDRGHRFATSCDTEILVHLWEEYGEQLFDHLQGQFAFALYDTKQRTLILARDRFGICPLHWATKGERLYFGSEVKALLASGEIEARADLRGIDHIFSMFAMPARRTPFEGVQSLLPGTYMRVRLGTETESVQIDEKRYWDLDFPDQGAESSAPPQTIIDEFGELLVAAVRRRLQADVPVAGYLSGGVDSAVICAVAARLSESPIDVYTIKIDSSGFDEERSAKANAEAIRCRQHLVTRTPSQLHASYHRLVWAAENPVVDTSCAALLTLAGVLREDGYKVTLTGEGADEALAGYPWFKANRLLNMGDWGPFGLSGVYREMVRRIASPTLTRDDARSLERSLGGPVAPADLYRLVSANRRRFLHARTLDALEGHSVFDELDLNLPRMARWDPLNRSIYVAYKTMLPGMLLSHKSDRVAAANSIEARYPFLDEKLVEFCCRLPVRWKLRGLRRDKVVLREFAKRILPDAVATRPKKMFRAPFADTVVAGDGGLVEQLLSPDSLRATGYFDVRAVERSLARARLHRGRWRCDPFEEMGLVGVFGTQLWHHLFIGGGLCELPAMEA